MPLFERFNKACEHVNDALQFKHPRTDISKPNLSRTRVTLKSRYAAQIILKVKNQRKIIMKNEK
jgi:hypothetical protein